MPKIFISQLTNPYLNLAIEDWLFREYSEHSPILFLWQNSPSVIIGRAQNPWVECNLEFMKNNKINFLRRQSGGGTVYHDLGNLNYSLMSPKTIYNKQNNLNLICKALAHPNIQIKAYPNQRNDILVDPPSHFSDSTPRKISGSAFRETANKCFHHGTLLINADLTHLSKCLHPDKINQNIIKSKGVKSVRSKVINLSQLNPQVTVQKVIESLSNCFSQFYQSTKTIKTTKTTIEPIIFTPKNFNPHPDILKTQTLYQSWEWQYAKTLPFEHLIDWLFKNKIYKIKIKVAQGLIKNIDVLPDISDPNIISYFKNLISKPYFLENFSQIILEKQIRA